MKLLISIYRGVVALAMATVLAACAGTTQQPLWTSNSPVPFVLGVGVSDASPDWRDHHGYARAVMVDLVVKDSPAEKAGIKKGDIIVKVDDAPVDWSNKFRPLVYKYAGRECTLTVYHGEEKKLVKVALNKGN